MKKQNTSLRLRKQTISALIAASINGGAPTTHSMITMADDCVSQRGCEPVPQEPLPEPGISHSNCDNCTSGSWNTTC